MIDPSIRLQRAIYLNDLLLVKRVTENHPDVLQNPDFADKSNTSLHLAARLGYLHIVVRLPLPLSHHKAGLHRRYTGTLKARGRTDLPHRRRPRRQRHIAQCRVRHAAHARRIGLRRRRRRQHRRFRRPDHQRLARPSGGAPSHALRARRQLEQQTRPGRRRQAPIPISS